MDLQLVMYINEFTLQLHELAIICMFSHIYHLFHQETIIYTHLNLEIGGFGIGAYRMVNCELLMIEVLRYTIKRDCGALFTELTLRTH